MFSARVSHPMCSSKRSDLDFSVRQEAVARLCDPHLVQFPSAGFSALFDHAFCFGSASRGRCLFRVVSIISLYHGRLDAGPYRPAVSPPICRLRT